MLVEDVINREMVILAKNGINNSCQGGNNVVR